LTNPNICFIDIYRVDSYQEEDPSADTRPLETNNVPDNSKTSPDKPLKGREDGNIFADKEETMDAILEAEEKAKTPSELRLERAMNKHRENRVALANATSKCPGCIGSAASWYAEKRSYLRAQWIHYGPPYQPDYGGDLPSEIAKDMNISISDVNTMLNDGADPNIGSVTDMNNTPLHYVARWGRARLAKMLFEAGANPNKQNELGITPLGTACMFNQGESEYRFGRKKFVNIRSRRKEHVKFIELLINHGSNVEHIDRGGHTPIEHASFHGNMEVVTLLLQKGAKTVRSTEFLALLQPAPLDYAWKSDVKHILTLRAQVEADELKEKQQVQQKRLMEKLAAEEYERRYQERKLQRQEYLTEQKRNRVLAEREKAHQERLKAEEIREKQRKIDMMLKSKNEIVGTWQKTEYKGKWKFFPGTELATREANMIAETEFLHKNLSKSSTSGPVLRKRWKGTTGIRLSRPQGPEGFEAVMSTKYVLRIPEDGTDLYEDRWVKEPLKKTKTANGPAVAMNNKKKKLARRAKRIAPGGSAAQESRHDTRQE
jgi:hypothetical protein